MREALDRTGAVITTGGLGPTSDDLTKPSIAALFGREMQLDEAHLAWMEERWRRRFDRPLPAANRQQAMIPDGARQSQRIDHGSAPGIWLEDDRGRWVAMLPGVPREMRGMLADTLLPRLARAHRRRATVVRSRTLRTTGVAESRSPTSIESIAGGPLGVVARLSAVDRRRRPPAHGARTCRRTTPTRAARAAAARLRERRRRVDLRRRRRPISPRSCSMLCRARGLTIAVAESCTGGLLGARLTAIPGSSDVVLGGVIAYHNDVKRDLLGVRRGDRCASTAR